MKNVIIASTILVSGSMFLVQPGMINSLVLFLLIGAIPGTQALIPSKIMLLIFISLLWLVLISLSLQLATKKSRLTVRRLREA